MPFIKTSQVAMFEGADWSQFKRVVPNCSPQQAQRIAIADPTIAFFFFCNEPVVLNNPSWPASRVFNPGDAVFFGGAPWWGSAPQCDGFVKQGLTMAYIDGLSAANPTLPMIAGQYRTAQGLNAVDIVSLFAANLSQTVPAGYIRLAPAVPLPAGATLAIASAFYPNMIGQCVATLQAQGLTVLVSFLNNHDNAGWSAFDPTTPAGQADARNFALQMQAVVETYGFDGIDIDDEYSEGPAYPSSLAMVTSMMRQLMPDKIISKALFNDAGFFGQPYEGVTLEQSLTYGWNMTYWLTAAEALQPYVGLGMTPAALAMGFQAGMSSDVDAQVAWLQSNGYAGVMVYPFETPPNQALMGEMVDVWMGAGNWVGPS